MADNKLNCFCFVTILETIYLSVNEPISIRKKFLKLFNCEQTDVLWFVKTVTYKLLVYKSYFISIYKYSKYFSTGALGNAHHSFNATSTRCTLSRSGCTRYTLSRSGFTYYKPI